MADENENENQTEFTTPDGVRVTEERQDEYTVTHFDFPKDLSFTQAMEDSDAEGDGRRADQPTVLGVAIEALMERLFGGPKMPKDPKVLNALTFLMPIIDAGIDALAMEGWVKDEKYRSISGQFEMRSELAEGTFLAFDNLGVTQSEVEAVVTQVERSGWTMKQDGEMVADRITVWDELSITNMLYGPRVTGEILHQRHVTDESVSVEEFEEARKVHAQTCPVCRED